ncbi:hypothetical protein [Pseudomonas citronellolis]|uniref:hypothetical protein n=1 Tax=Pseudomonas citronellolis TaxID=53408 RepID=UPI0023E43BB3|nr:hypothetical protein [Pseudomonas citronellolis]MDF3931381.1 hypothetical protein [Pseudomonas citronellolis]
MTWLDILKRLAGPVAVISILLLIVAGAEAMQALSRQQGYDLAKAEGQAALEQLQRKYAEADTKRARQAEDDAKAAANRLASEQSRANKLAAALAEQQRQHRKTTDHLAGEIARVNDLYREALDAPPKPVPACVLTRGWVRVYDEATGARVPAARPAAGAATPAGAGDPADQLPAGIDQRAVLEHHVRYAEQCRNTAAQLDALIDAVEGH